VATTTLPPTTIPPKPLVISTAEIPGGTTGGTYLVFLKGSGGTPPLRWQITRGELPSGLELLPSGLIRGNPDSPGIYDFGLRVDDSLGDSASENFNIEFVDPLKIETTFIPDVLVGEQLERSFIASGGKKPYIWEIKQGFLPEEIDFSEAGTLLGVPQKSESYEITLVLNDSLGSAVENDFSLNIIENLVIETKSIPLSVNGESYLFQFEASGGSEPYFWTLSSGSLPEGLLLEEDGKLTGTPTIISNSQIYVKVSDSSGRSASFPYIFIVSLKNQEQQTVVARGGSIVININENIIRFIESTSNSGFTGYLVNPGPEKVQFHFISDSNQTPSWILCEFNNDVDASVVCSFD
tara:strand:- start:91 stop:1146 length:1056 start_codon:yes stop_codon:yes gene_type:complete